MPMSVIAILARALDHPLQSLQTWLHNVAASFHMQQAWFLLHWHTQVLSWKDWLGHDCFFYYRDSQDL